MAVICLCFWISSGPESGYFEAVDHDPAGVEGLDAAEDLQEGALAAPAPPHDSQDLTLSCVEAHPPEGLHPAVFQLVDFGYVINLEQYQDLLYLIILANV